jgi:hypothetical protein
VVVYFYDDDHAEGQHTVVTERQGPLAGQRVVRGREEECHVLFARPPRGIQGGRRRRTDPVATTAPMPGGASA